MKASTPLRFLSLCALASGQCVGDFVASGLSLTESVEETRPTATSSSTRPLALTTGSPYGNVSVDECWSSWEDYWQFTFDQTEIFSTPVATVTSTLIETISSFSGHTYTFTSTIDTTVTM